MVMMMGNEILIVVDFGGDFWGTWETFEATCWESNQQQAHVYNWFLLSFIYKKTLWRVQNINLRKQSGGGITWRSIEDVKVSMQILFKTLHVKTSQLVRDVLFVFLLLICFERKGLGLRYYVGGTRGLILNCIGW